MARVQRTRLLAAMTDVVCERGPSDVTVSHVVDRAGVSRRTFYELFEDGHACLLAALEHSLEQAQEAVLADYDPSARWLERVRSGLLGLLSFVDEDPRAGRLLIVESLGAGPWALERRGQLVGRLVGIVEEGALETKDAVSATRLTAEGVVGGVLAVLHSHFAEERPELASSLASGLMSMIVLPYLGVRAARRELERPVAQRVAQAPAIVSGDLFRGLEARLTYRTVRVLLAIGAHPGSSNRQVGAAAGMSDQGQISKLLGRLRRLGLIDSGTPMTRAGKPNKWTLTQHGSEIQQTLGGRKAKTPQRV